MTQEHPVTLSEEPTDKQLAELYRKAYYECENRQGDAAQVFALRAVLARWGNHPESPDSSTQPIPVSERLPGPEDCNSKGECWWLHPGDEDCGAFWTLFDGRYRVGCTHWLPAHALPQPS